MNLLSVNQLSKSFSDQLLFSNVSFGIDKGQKLGLIAQNGAGKSTLFRILMGQDIQDEGSFAYRDSVVRQMLAQEPNIPSSHTVHHYVSQDNPRLLLIEQYQKMIEAGNMESDEFKELSNQIDASNAWEEENKIIEILDGLNFKDLQLSCKNLSGGEKRRLALAKAIIDEPDILFLDEPTNHLDFKMVEWLEKFLGNSNMAILLITHDRYFLDNLCDHILELTPEKLYTHNGNYEFFLESKAEREANMATQIQKAKNLYSKELEWLRRMPKARGTKSKSRIDAAHQLEKKAKQRVQKHELDIATGMQRLGKKIIEVKRLNKYYGDRHIINDFNYFFQNGEKIGIVGDNGAGKTTFLNLIAGLDKEHTGHINKGDTVSIGYYTQKGLNIKSGQKVIDVVRDIAEVIELKDGSKITASQMLNKFNFAPKKQHDFVEKLSGGERKRLYLVTVLIKAPNFLILDEPTNDLDILTLSVLEEYLLNFKGCVLIVSHDRYFLDRIIDHLFVFQSNGEIKDFPGNYTQLRAFQKEEERENKKLKTENKTADKESKVKENKGLTYKEKLELEELEKEIAELETKKSQLEQQFSSPELSGEELNQCSVELSQLMSTLEEKSDRWLSLASKAD